MVQLFSNLISSAYKVPSGTPKICPRFWASSHSADLRSTGRIFRRPQRIMDISFTGIPEVFYISLTGYRLHLARGSWCLLLEMSIYELNFSYMAEEEGLLFLGLPEHCLACDLAPSFLRWGPRQSSCCRPIWLCRWDQLRLWNIQRPKRCFTKRIILYLLVHKGNILELVST